jgi:hypothetical protein
MFRNPITPLNGALISVFLICSFNKSISAFILLNSVEAMSYNSLLIAPFSNKVLFRFSVSSFSFFVAVAFLS